jgi:ATP-binding cassette subfamily B protein
MSRAIADAHWRRSAPCSRRRWRARRARGAAHGDFGFSNESIDLIDSYFAVMLAVAGVLALASAMRFYLVTTLGERIVADLRSEVFAHLTALSIPFFDQAKSGELVSRLTADTTQIKAAVGSSISVALRNIVLFLGAALMMVVTARAVAGIPPTIAFTASALCAAVRARRRTHSRMPSLCRRLIGAVGIAGFHQRETHNRSLQRRGRARLRGGRQSTRARAFPTAVAIFLVFASVVVVLWVAAQDVMSGEITPGRLSQFVLYAVFAASGLGQLSEVWGEISQASGAADRLFEIIAVKPAIEAPASPIASMATIRPRSRLRSTTCDSSIPRGWMLR